MRMRSILSGLAVFTFFVSIAMGSDNSKPIEGVLRSHNDSVAKADEIRAKAVEKSTRETVLQLTRLASKAFSEKDRVSETNAWKAILTVDRSNPKATQYFKDLGTLEKTLAELPPESAPAHAPQTGIVGKWLVFRDNNAAKSSTGMDFRPDGTILTGKGNDWKPWGTLVVEGNSLIARSTDGPVSRFTVMGDKLIQAQWADGFPNDAPTWFYYATRVK